MTVLDRINKALEVSTSQSFVLSITDVQEILAEIERLKGLLEDRNETAELARKNFERAVTAVNRPEAIMYLANPPHASWSGAEKSKTIRQD